MPLPTLQPLPDASAFAVGGYQPFSVSDWPGHLAAVVFAQGCPLRCGYCHNPHLLPSGPGTLTFAAVLSSLAHRRGLLDAVVFSGGEPCAQRQLPEAVEAVSALDFPVALHTSGVNPVMLKRLVPQLAWVGLDIKAPPGDYARITGAQCERRVGQSLDVLLEAGIDFEVRTTWHPDLFSTEALFDLAQNLAARGVAHYAVQCLRTSPDGGRHWVPGPPPPPHAVAEMASWFQQFSLRE